MKLLLFNPENDLSLANGDPNFVPPVSARKMSSDLCRLPLWWRGPDDRLFDDTAVSSISGVTGCLPWGWSAAVRHRFVRGGVAEQLLPSTDQIECIRQLSHRSTSVDLLAWILSSYSGESFGMPELPQVLTNLEQANDFCRNNPSFVLKTPWSSSGKGLCWSGQLDNRSREAWISSVIKKMGSLIGERAYDKQLDFALIYHFDEVGQLQFCGYSLFETDQRGAYSCNRLLSNEAILRQIGLQIDIEEFLQVKSTLEKAIREVVQTNYVGYLGIDMMICNAEDGQGSLLHPCVELNLRMTMGGVARILYDRYMCRGEGVFRIVYRSAPGMLLESYGQMPVMDPREINIFPAGVSLLTDVTEFSQYVAVVERF